MCPDVIANDIYVDNVGKISFRPNLEALLILSASSGFVEMIYM